MSSFFSLDWESKYKDYNIVKTVVQFVIVKFEVSVLSDCDLIFWTIWSIKCHILENTILLW